MRSTDRDGRNVLTLSLVELLRSSRRTRRGPSRRQAGVVKLRDASPTSTRRDRSPTNQPQPLQPLQSTGHCLVQTYVQHATEICDKGRQETVVHPKFLVVEKTSVAKLLLLRKIALQNAKYGV